MPEREYPSSAEIDYLDKLYIRTGSIIVGRILSMRLRDHGNYEGYARHIDKEVYNAQLRMEELGIIYKPPVRPKLGRRLKPRPNLHTNTTDEASLDAGATQSKPAILPPSLQTHQPPEGQRVQPTGGQGNYRALPRSLQTNRGPANIQPTGYHGHGGSYLPPGLRTGGR